MRKIFGLIILATLLFIFFPFQVKSDPAGSYIKFIAKVEDVDIYGVISFQKTRYKVTLDGVDAPPEFIRDFLIDRVLHCQSVCPKTSISGTAQNAFKARCGIFLENAIAFNVNRKINDFFSNEYVPTQNNQCR